MFEETDLMLNIESRHISYKSFKTQNLPTENSYQCKILTVITETLLVQPAGFNTINDDIHEHTLY